MALFSVVIPVYKVEAYLPKCLDSVLGQTHSDWECVCVDDGSPDGCGAILDDYAKRDARFRVIHQSNRGVSAARNAALDVATGDWVQFLDSDDSLALDFLERLAEKIKLYPDVDAIEHSAVYCYDDGTRKVGTPSGQLPPAGVVSAQQILADPYGKKYTSLGRCACYKIFRNDVLEEHRLRFAEGMPLGEDSLFATHFYTCAGKIALCPDVAGYLRIFRDGSALRSMSARTIILSLRGIEELYKVWQCNPSRGLAITLSAKILAAGYLGKKSGQEVYDQCRESVLSSRFYNRVAIPFLICHGTYKMRLFAMAYLFSPRRIRRAILGRL